MNKESLQQKAILLAISGFLLAFAGTGAFIGGIISLEIFRFVCIFLGFLMIITVISVYKAFFETDK